MKGKYTVSPYVPPAYAVRLGESRMEPFVAAYQHAQRFSAQIAALSRQPVPTLLDLAVSAYLQGIEDTVQSSVANGFDFGGEGWCRAGTAAQRDGDEANECGTNGSGVGEILGRQRQHRNSSRRTVRATRAAMPHDRKTRPAHQDEPPLCGHGRRLVWMVGERYMSDLETKPDPKKDEQADHCGRPSCCDRQWKHANGTGPCLVRFCKCDAFVNAPGRKWGWK